MQGERIRTDASSQAIHLPQRLPQIDSAVTQDDPASRFTAQLLRPEVDENGSGWAFVLVPKEASARLPRRGRLTVDVTINGRAFQSLIEPDGQKSHWLKIDERLLEVADCTFGDLARFEIRALEHEPEPGVPPDLAKALQASAKARAIWDATTTLARVDWIHWITSARQAPTRQKRIADACEMLAAGKKRVCCFDPSGYYSKAFSAPRAATAQPVAHDG